jgi:copper chaperone CopZ
MSKSLSKAQELAKELEIAKDRLIYIAVSMSAAASEGDETKVNRAIANIKGYANQVLNLSNSIKNIKKNKKKVTVDQRTKFFDNEGWYADDATVLKWIKKNGR